MQRKAPPQSTQQDQKDIPRFADAEDMKVLYNLGYPEDDEVVEIREAGPNSQNPGRIFWKTPTRFLFFDDDKRKYNKEEHEEKLNKRKRDVEAYHQVKRIKIDYDFDIHKKVDQLEQELIEVNEVNKKLWEELLMIHAFHEKVEERFFKIENKK